MPWAHAQRSSEGATSTSAATLGDGYRVRPGDRLGLLADRFGVSVPELARANDLQAPYVIRIGQVLRVPRHAPGARPQETRVAQTESRSAAIAPIEAAPLVRESFGGTAKDGVPTRQVAALDVVALPPPASNIARPPAGARAMPQLKAAKAGPAEARYTVRSGETLSGIARRLDVGLTELAQANDLSEPYPVYTGQKLRLPGQGSFRTTTIRLGEDDERTVRLATGEPPPLQGDDFLWPVNGKVIGKYGRIDQWRRRDGIDIAARRGAPVLAAQDGIVAYAGDGIRGYGQMVLLRHDQDYITTYAHNATLLVRAGDVVRRGQVIARVGDSGDATQTMLHFELRKGRKPIDPESRLITDSRTLASAE